MSTVTSEITPNTTVTFLLDLVAKKENISNPEYVVTHNMKKGDGFMSVIYDAKIKKDNKEVLSVITKIAPDNMLFREQGNIRIIYENEILYYNVIYPAFNEFQKEIGLEEIFEYAPKCYGTSLEEVKEGLVLENLRDKGYSRWNRMIPMDDNHIELTLKTYAKYHALNFAFKDHHKEKFDEFSSKLQDTIERLVTNPIYQQAFEGIVANLINCFDPVKDKEYITKFMNYMQKIKEQPDLLFKQNMDEYSVIAHGDCWCNNMMYKYQDPNNPSKPTGICIFDFQIIRYSSPIMDFTYYFYTASSKKTMDNYEYYLNMYYDSLTDFIKQFGSDPEKLYPRSVFDAHWKKYCVNGIHTAMFMIKVLTTETEEIPDFTQMTGNDDIVNAMQQQPKSTEFETRIRDLIVHFCEKGLI